MSDKNGASPGGYAVQKRGWPEGFWEELERDSLPDDFDVGEELPDQADRAVGWYDKPMDEWVKWSEGTYLVMLDKWVVGAYLDASRGGRSAEEVPGHAVHQRRESGRASAQGVPT